MAMGWTTQPSLGCKAPFLIKLLLCNKEGEKYLTDPLDPTNGIPGEH